MTGRVTRAAMISNSPTPQLGQRHVYVEHMLRQPLPTDAVWSSLHSLDFALDRVCPQATASAIVTGEMEAPLRGCRFVAGTGQSRDQVGRRKPVIREDGPAGGNSEWIIMGRLWPVAARGDRQASCRPSRWR